MQDYSVALGTINLKHKCEIFGELFNGLLSNCGSVRSPAHDSSAVDATHQQFVASRARARDGARAVVAAESLPAGTDGGDGHMLRVSGLGLFAAKSIRCDETVCHYSALQSTVLQVRAWPGPVRARRNACAHPVRLKILFSKRGCAALYYSQPQASAATLRTPPHETLRAELSAARRPRSGPRPAAAGRGGCVAALAAAACPSAAAPETRCTRPQPGPSGRAKHRARIPKSAHPKID